MRKFALILVLILSLVCSATLVSEDTSGIYVAGENEQEVVIRRTRCFKTFANGNNQYRVAGQVGPIHYRLDPFSDTEEYKEIDLDILLTPGENWDAACETNGYQVRFWNSRQIEGKTVRYIAQFRRAGGWVAIAPLALVWENDTERELISKTQGGIQPVIDNDLNIITWPNAFGQGIDFRYNLRPDEFIKTVIINNPSKLPSPSISQEGLKLTIVMAATWQAGQLTNGFARGMQPSDLAVDADLTNSDEEIDGTKLFSFQDNLLRDLFCLQPPKAWDSAENRHVYDMTRQLKRKGPYAFILLNIPYRALAHPDVVYPVYIDDDISEERVGASSDDAQNYGASWPGDGNYNHTGISMSIGVHDGMPIDGFRFTSVPLPQGCIIDSSYLSVPFYNGSSSAIDIDVACEDVDSASTFASSTHEPYDAYLARTTAVDTWAIDESWSPTGTWCGGEGEPDENDISSPIQEIVDRPGWESGNDLLLVLWCHSESPPTVWRNILTYDQSSSYGAKFNCSYTTAVAGAQVIINIL